MTFSRVIFLFGDNKLPELVLSMRSSVVEFKKLIFGQNSGLHKNLKGNVYEQIQIQKETIDLIIFQVFSMSKNIQKPKSRREHDQMKRDRMNNQTSVPDREGIIEKCKKLVRRKNSEN